MKKTNNHNFLREHLNIFWLRPESALWDAIASDLICRYPVLSPSLDLGCGNGVFSFITAGGRFSQNYDMYFNLSPDGFWENKDIYNSMNGKNVNKYIVKKSEYQFDYGLDYKINLLHQARMLNFYRKLVHYDANKKLPFPDNSLMTIFSNIAPWLEDPKNFLKDMYRLLTDNGELILCLPNIKFKDYCFTYNFAGSRFAGLLKMLNRGRLENLRWSASYEDFSAICKNSGFKIIDHKYYLSALTLKIWDIGLRPLSPLLIKMSNKLKAKDRFILKREWVETFLKFLEPLYEAERENGAEGGFHLFVLKKESKLI